MIALGYPGEISSDVVTRLVWGTLSTVPFVYILYVLWSELGTVMASETEEVRSTLRGLRLLLLASWGVYPIAYLLPLLHLDPASALVGRQVGYSIADVVAKPAYGLLIYAIIRMKSQKEEAPLGALVDVH